ncbi:MAG: shikimate kinase, partial [Rhodovibrionaceae bacterium]
PKVVATGGGAYMDPDTRAAIAQAAVSVWLRADLELLVRRTSRRNTRPLLRSGDPREILSRLIDERYPLYAKADITVDSADAPPEKTVQRVIDALEARGRETTRQGAVG